MSATTYLAASSTQSESTSTTTPSTTTPSITTATVRPARPARRSARAVAVTTARSALAEGRSYYATGQARTRLLIMAVALTYGGGAAMFYLHAIVRGEQGPAIANLWHWLLDSTLGFIGLTPALVVLLPLTAKVMKSRTASYVAAGGLFGLMTAPGPVLHNLIAGSGTPLARAATSFFGTDPGVAAAQAEAAHTHAGHVHAADPSAVSSVLAQLGVGLPVYVGLAVLAGTALHRIHTRTRTAGPDHTLALAAA